MPDQVPEGVGPSVFDMMSEKDRAAALASCKQAEGAMVDALAIRIFQLQQRLDLPQRLGQPVTLTKEEVAMAYLACASFTRKRLLKEMGFQEGTT